MHASTLTQVLAIVGFALLTAFGAQVRVYLWEVPLTLQTFAVYGSGLYLGWRSGMLAQLLYLALGLFQPVFAGDGLGLAYLFGAASVGYMLAFPVVVGLTGWLSRRWNTLIGSALALLGGAVVLFVVGVVWLHYAAGHATWLESDDKGWLLFAKVDLAKILAVSLFYTGTRRV